MHVSPAVLHLHFFAHVGSALQPHLISSLQPTTAVGRMGHPVSSRVHPKPSGLAERLQAISPYIGFLVKIVHLVITCRAVVRDTCKLLNAEM